MKVGPEEQAMWDDYASEPTPAKRDRIISRYYEFARKVAGHRAGDFASHASQEEIIAYGLEGLVKAVDGYDPANAAGTPFRVYALRVIPGAIYDELRRQDWAPRPLRAQQKQVQRATEEFQRLYHRNPTERELLEVLGWTSADLREVEQRLRRADQWSLDKTFDHEDGSAGMQVGSSEPTQATTITLGEVGREVVALLRAMPRESRALIALRYYWGLTVTQSGEVVGLSEQKASHVHTETVMAISELVEQHLTT